LWYSDLARRIVFECPLRRINSTVRARGPVNLGHYEINVTIELIEGTQRRVRIVFDDDRPTVPRVVVIGEERQQGWPHRYGDGSLCMWFPKDPPEQRWLLEDGLLALIGYVEAHLFREIWWLEHDEWLGPEAGHGPPTWDRRRAA